MIIRLLNFISGYVYLEVYGDKKERFINLCRSRQVAIWKVKDIQGGYGFYIYAKDVKLLKEIVKKTRMKIRIKERYGLPFFLFRHRKRKAFVLGIVTAFVIIYIMSLFIWDISVDGNYSYSKQELIKFLEENGITHGMRKSETDCEAIEKLIRNNYFDVTWVSVELKGTRLIVHMRENFDDVQNISEQPGEEGGGQEDTDAGYMIVSNRDAVIESIITRTGVPMVKSGDTVTEGTVLIDGKYDIMGDYEEYIRTQYVRADGDVYGYVTYRFDESVEREYILRTYTGREHTYRKIRINDNALELKIGGIEFEKYDKIETEQQLSIVGDFYVPVYYSEILCREYVTETVEYGDEELEALLNRKISYFMENLSKKGIQIIENNVKIEIGTGEAHASGDILVLEKIGTIQPVVQIMEEAEETDE